LFGTIDDIKISETKKARYNKPLDEKLHQQILNSNVGDVIVVGTRLGGGKSFLTLKLMNSYFAYDEIVHKYIYLTPTHRLGIETVETFKKTIDNKELEKKYELFEIKGKTNYCIHGEYIKSSEEYRIPLSYFCEECPEKFGKDGTRQCEFWYRLNYLLKTGESWMGVHAFLGNIANFLIEKSHYLDVIIDELPYSTIFVSERITEKNLGGALSYLNDNASECMERQFIIGILNHLCLLISHNEELKIEKIKKQGVLDSLFHLISGNDMNLKDKIVEFVEELLKKIRNMIMINVKTTSIPKNIGFLLTLSKIINKNMREKKDVEFLKYSIDVNPRRIKKRFFNELTLHYCDLSILNVEDVRLWILDGTTHPSFYKSIFSKERLIFIDNSYEIHNDFLVIYSNEHKYGINKLILRDKEKKTYEDTSIFKEIYGITRRIVERFEKKRILIVCRKSNKIQEILIQKLKNDFPNKKIYCHLSSKQKDDTKTIQESDISIDYYGAIRGINSYIGYDICVLFGGAFPNPKDIRRQSVISGINKDVMLKTQREDEMNQSWGRIRPTKSSIIFVFCDIDLGFKNIHNIYKLTNEQIIKFLNTDILIDNETFYRLCSDKDFVISTIENQKNEKYKIPFLDEYKKKIKDEFNEQSNKIKREIDLYKNGIDLSELKKKFKYELFDVIIRYLIDKKQVNIKSYNTSLHSKNKKKRVFTKDYDVEKFDTYTTMIENMKIDGKKLEVSLYNQILYLIKYVNENRTLNQIFIELKIKNTNENIEIVKSIVFEMKKRNEIEEKQVKSHKYLNYKNRDIEQ